MPPCARFGIVVTFGTFCPARALPLVRACVTVTEDSAASLSVVRAPLTG